MENVRFINYTEKDRFSENYQKLADFFLKYTGNASQENWHIGRLD